MLILASSFAPTQQLRLERGKSRAEQSRAVSGQSSPSGHDVRDGVSSRPVCGRRFNIPAEIEIGATSQGCQARQHASNPEPTGISMRIGGRSLTTVLAAALQKRHYEAFSNAFSVYQAPVATLSRYLFNTGTYPTTVSLKTPLGPLDLNLFSLHDLLTVNEIFCRLDYLSDASDRVCVDFGSNIGVSAAYFLTRSPHSFVYLFEPLPQNLQRLKINLSPFEARYLLQPVAVALSDGEVEFGWEPTGRYGGIDRKTGSYLRVQCVDSNRVLEEVIAKHGIIDILKIDTEALEREFVERMPPQITKCIRKIYVENCFPSNPLESSHRYRQRGPIAGFFRNF